MRGWKGVVVVVLAAVLGSAGVVPAEASAGRAVAKSAARGIKRAISKRLTAKLVAARARDAQRDAARRAVSLVRPRTVFRYTSGTRAAAETRRGIPAKVHTTASGSPGRPMSGAKAARVLGLDAIPVRRETIRLEKGALVKPGRVLGGARKGELRTAARVPPKAITRVVRLP